MKTSTILKSSYYLSIFFLIGIFAGCHHNGPNTLQNSILIYHAGSLSVPVKEISKAFQNEYPEVEILTEAAGSVACARKIIDLQRPCDLMISADYTVIDKFLIPEYADWNIKFASNEMVIAYHQKSKMANEINETNWMNILMEEQVKYGRSDPNSDPCGYRTVLSIKLSEDYYKIQSFTENILTKNNRYIRPKETDLIALLETQTIDYIFIYKSVAVQHNLNYLLLPDSINLKNPDLSEWYNKFSVEINGKKPGEKTIQIGEPMVYGLTIPHNAPNKELAIRFTSFLLDKNKGMKIIEKNGQPSLVPSPSSTWQQIPKPLNQFALPQK